MACSRRPPAGRPRPARRNGTGGTEALLDFARPGGFLDANDDLAAGPVRLITDPDLRTNNPDNPTMTAGLTFLGQFLDHDVTFDVGSTLGVATDPKRAVNGRTPRLDLDSVYGAGPGASSHLYEPTDTARLKIETGGAYEDLPRDERMNAVIGDRRNDENLFIAGLQSAFLKFHNRALATVRAGRRPEDRRLRAGPPPHHLALPVDRRQ